MVTKEFLQKLYGHNVQVELCKECEGQGSIEITISRINDTFHLNLADYATAASILSFAKEKGLTASLKVSGDVISLLTRCVCFQVTDPDGTRTECFLCQEPPDVHCAGPFPYCPSDKAIFNVVEDDSIKYVSVGKVHLPNEICIEGWAAMLNSSGQPGGPTRNIRVYYNFNNQPRVCDTVPLPPIPDPKQIYTLLGCWGGDYVITRSQYI